jgi:very-short-patch-repair endonuclease
MQVDDRDQLAAVWLVDGPGPAALWPLTLGGRYAEHRGEWYFPKGTRVDAILRAAGADESRGDGDAATNGHAAAGVEGLFDPLVEEVEEHGVEVEADDSPRVQAVARAVQAWTDQLIDRSARNNLLFFRDQRAGTLDLAKAPPRLVFDILAGRSRHLAQLFPDDEDAVADAARRSRTIHNKAQAIYEERGIHTLYLACGLATWDNQHGTAEPAAPVLLAPATLTAHGAAQQNFDLQVTGELEVNPTLLNALAAEFDIECDPEELLASAGMEGAIDRPEELEIAYAWLADKARRVPGFAVRQKTVLGNFSYAKLPMVRDLQCSVEALAGHDLIAALAGDAEARQAVRDRRADVDPTLPDQTAPADEFLVLDADSSQNFAINKVLCGQDLVIKGPPGTGKSQTISNLISCLVARGQTVLFVAEKRAAIDAVLKRLEQVGLHDLILDLHGGVSSKRQVAQSLAHALRTNATIAEPNLSHEHQRLEARRRELNDWQAALHEKREPWSLSLFAAEERLLALGEEAETEVRLRGQKLHTLTADGLDRAREQLREFVGLGGLHAALASPWTGSPITTRAEVERALDLVYDLTLRRLEPLLNRLEHATASVGMPAPDSVHGWADRLLLWSSARDTLEHFEPELFEEDVAPLVERLAPLGDGMGARMSAAMGDGDYRAAHKRAKALQSEGVKLRRAGLLHALQAAADQQRQWNAAGANGRPRPPEDLDDLLADHTAMTKALEELSTLAGTDVAEGPRTAVIKQLHALRRDGATLGRLPHLHRLREALDSAGLTELVDDLATWNPDAEGALDTFEFCLMASIVDDIRLSDRRVGGFDGHQHSSTVEDFQHADRRHIATTAQRVRRLAAERAHRVGDDEPDQATLVKREAAKKSRHLPVRETFNTAPEVMTSIKPCWIMSPLVVSQVLPNDRPYFDVVIFDEASQVRPAEAIPAIARGRRLIVAGDEKQLPPTDFFSGPVIATDGDDDGLTLAATGSEFESVLDALEFLVEPQMLEWHYRSADERLIAFSNAHLYGKALLTFPGVSGAECLRHVHVPWTPGQADGEDSSNAEVLKVVELILEHAEERPEQSFGVIAMGIKHAERIDAALRNALRERSDLDEFFDENHPERFFVKNLERVQGDERDAILLTVGYGKGADGQMVYRFGPLNEEGGERRLNVAVTRARRRMTAVSSFTAADMDPERTKRGGDLLRLYLAYAESCGEKLDRQAAEAPKLNAFELDIRDALEKAGVPLVCQHGVGRYRLDFAAKHPEKPGRLVLAIEADGASYHSAETARDRDRLRQEQLERLGWRFHRIWSQDWFTDRKHEIEKAVAAYHAAVGESDDPAAAAPAAIVPAAPPVAAAPRGKERTPRPGLFAWGQIDEFTDRDLQSMVLWIESDTLLRSREDLIAEVMAELGFERRGKKIVSRIAAAIDAVRAQPRT